MGALKVSVNARRVATVTFDSPPRNLFDYSVYNEFGSVFGSLSDRDDVSAVILNARGKNFSCGHEVAELQRVSARNIDEHYKIVGEGLSAVYTCKKPTIAAVQGMAIGAGLAAAAACDIILAADDAFLFVPEITVGIIGAYGFLRALLPSKLARYYSYTGKPIPAYKLFQWGSIFALFPEKELNAAAERVAGELLERSAPIALTCFKQAMNDIDNDRLKEKFYQEHVYGKQFVTTDDYIETASSFLQKRKPVYTGRR
jgi:enoyl-CoA hydratase